MSNWLEKMQKLGVGRPWQHGKVEECQGGTGLELQVWYSKDLRLHGCPLATLAPQATPLAVLARHRGQAGYHGYDAQTN